MSTHFCKLLCPPSIMIHLLCSRLCPTEIGRIKVGKVFDHGHGTPEAPKVQHVHTIHLFSRFFTPHTSAQPSLEMAPNSSGYERFCRALPNEPILQQRRVQHCNTSDLLTSSIKKNWTIVYSFKNVFGILHVDCLWIMDNYDVLPFSDLNRLNPFRSHAFAAQGAKATATLARHWGVNSSGLNCIELGLRGHHPRDGNDKVTP